MFTPAVQAKMLQHDKTHSAIIDYMKSKGQGLNMDVRKNLDIPLSTFYRHMKELKEEKIPGLYIDSRTFAYADDVAKNKLNEKEKYDDVHTEEGYNDPTTKSVMKNAIKYVPEDVGKVARFQTADSSIMLFMALSIHRNCILGIPLTDPEISAINDPESDYVIPTIFNGHRYFLDIRRMTSKPLKYLMGYYGILDTKTVANVHLAIKQLFGINTEIKIIEKPVEVPVPVKEIVKVEVPAKNTISDLELALMKQKIEIYEKILFK